MRFLVTLRHLVFALIVLGLASGSTVYAMPPLMGQMTATVGETQDVGMPCGMMSAKDAADVVAGKGKMPCNTITPDCVKKMVCLQTMAPPEQWEPSIGVVASALVTYPVSVHLPAGLTRKPELSPP